MVGGVVCFLLFIFFFFISLWRFSEFDICFLNCSLGSPERSIALRSGIGGCASSQTQIKTIKARASSFLLITISELDLEYRIIYRCWFRARAFVFESREVTGWLSAGSLVRFGMDFMGNGWMDERFDDVTRRKIYGE